MTFLAAVTSPRFVFLSCDLRITELEGRQVVDQSDWAMKATLLDAETIFGFAGLARIGDVLTDQWLAETLTEVDPASRLKVLATESTNEFKRQRIIMPHAYLGVGFRTLRKKPQPHAWIVTNSWNEEEQRFDPNDLDDRFALRDLPRQDSGITGIWTVGSEDETGEPATELIRETHAEIELTLRGNSADPRPVMDVLAALNQEVSDTRGDHIGASCVVTSLPRNAMQNSGIRIWTEPPGLNALSRFPFSANYKSDFRGPDAHYWRQPGLITSRGFSAMGVVVAPGQTSFRGPDPHRERGLEPEQPTQHR